jgi:uncharacterized protein (DUF427 family)
MKKPKPDKTKPGQESVWNYPRPPALEPFEGRVAVYFNKKIIADTSAAYRVLETNHPPGFYIPPEDIDHSMLEPSALQTGCEWKGTGKYYHLKDGDSYSENVACYYDDPTKTFQPIKNYLSFYPARVDKCTVNGKRVSPQPGEFYGGWITKNIAGPFKGIEGSWGW